MTGATHGVCPSGALQASDFAPSEIVESFVHGMVEKQRHRRYNLRPQTPALRAFIFSPRAKRAGTGLNRRVAHRK